MNKLRSYLNSLELADRPVFAASCKTTYGYLRKAISISQVLGPELCVAIEQASDGKVTRQDLRPDDFHLIWPELAKRKTAAGSPGRGS